MVESGYFGRYELRGLLGRGGMGEVYEAFDREQNRVVALKLLPKALIRDVGFVERFRRESFAAARLSDPHVIPIHRYGEIDGRLYLDMRLVKGRDLGQVIADDGPLPAARAASFVAQAAEALDAAHAENLVHRDVKPSNLLVTPQDFVYLVDFGIAHVFGLSTSGQALTATGATIGTLDYMAPERFIGRTEVDARADVYSLACVLYECLTGQRPYPVEGLPTLMHAHLNDPPPRAGAIRPDVPAALDQVIATGMAKDPVQRYPSTGELARAALLAVHGSPTSPGVGVTLPGVGVATPPTLLTPTPPTLLEGGVAGAAAARSLTPPTYVPPVTPASSGPVGTPPQRHRSRAAWIVAAAGVVLVALVAGLLVWRLGPGESTAAGQAAAATGTSVATSSVVSGTSGSEPVTSSSVVTPPSTSAPVPTQTVIVTSVVPQTVTEVVPPVLTPRPPARPAGDLGLSVPIANVGCTDRYLTLVHSATTPGSYEAEVAAMLASYPGTSYLRTDESCGSLAQHLNGNPIYAVYYGPFSTGEIACGARPSQDAYVKIMAAGIGPDESQHEC
jgi:hypothetical protein